MSKAEALAYVQRVFPTLTTGQHDAAGSPIASSIRASRPRADAAEDPRDLGVSGSVAR